jgi:hypothetical protein
VEVTERDAKPEELNRDDLEDDNSKHKQEAPEFGQRLRDHNEGRVQHPNQEDREESEITAKYAQFVLAEDQQQDRPKQKY